MVYMFVDGYVKTETDNRNAMQLYEAGMKQAFNHRYQSAEKLLDKARMRAKMEGENFDLMAVHSDIVAICQPSHPKEYLVN